MSSQSAPRFNFFRRIRRCYVREPQIVRCLILLRCLIRSITSTRSLRHYTRYPLCAIIPEGRRIWGFSRPALFRYIHNTSQKNSYICMLERLHARRGEKGEERKRREKEKVALREQGRMEKWICEEKEGRADDKSEIFCRHGGERSIRRIYTHMHVLTRVVSAVQTRAESRRLNEFWIRLNTAAIYLRDR